MIKGLYQELADLQAQRRSKQAFVDAKVGSARALHDAAVFVQTADAGVFSLMGAILESEEMAREIQGLLNRLHTAKHQSRHRSLALRHLEDAQSRLMRELGDKPVQS